MANGDPSLEIERLRRRVAALEAERQIHRLILESATEYAIFTSDLEGRVTTWNEGARRLLGWEEAEILGRPVGVIFTPEDREAGAPEAEIAGALATGRASDERWHMRQDGTVFYASGLLMPLRDEDGRVVGFLKILRDRTDRIQAEVELRISEERATALADALPLFVSYIDRDQRYQLVNKTYETWFGRARSALLGRTVREVLGDAAYEPRRPYIEAVLRGERVRFEAVTPQPSGVARHTEIDYLPRFDPDGSVAGFYAVVSDITERKEAEEAIRTSEAQLRLALEAGRLAIWEIDIATETVSSSPELNRLIGFPEDATPTLDEIRARYLPGERERLQAESREALMRGERFLELELRLRLPTGQIRSLMQRIEIHYDAEGRPERAVGVVLDVTEWREAEAAQRQSEAALRESEARFRAITNSVDQMIWSTRPDGFHDYYNQRWYDYTGVPEGSTDGEGWNDMFHPADQERAWGVWQRCLETGEPYHIEYRLRHRSGQYRWVLGRAQPVRDEAGRIVRWFGTCTDIQEIVEAREVLAQSRVKLEQRVEEALAERRLWSDIFETTDSLLAVMGPDFRYRAVNRAYADEFERIYGLRPKVGDSLLDLLADRPDHQQAAKAVWSRALAGERFTLMQEFGEESRVRPTYELRFDSLRDTQGQLVGAFQYATDVSERLRNDARLRETEEALRQAQKMEAVGQLTGGIAHDFNNLLAGIVGSLDLMQTRIRQGRIENVERYAQAAMTSAQRAAALTHRLLAFARRQPLDPRPVNVNTLVTSMEDLLRRTIGPSLAMEIVTAGGLWTTLCDPNQLESAILNLAINARDAMPMGGRLVIETANAHLDAAYAAAHQDLAPGQYVMVSVSDTGTGMPPDVIARAFDPFFTTKPLGQGTGLGLSMVYGFAKQSEGHVRIYSQEGQGTSIKIYLPRHRGAAAEDTLPTGSMAEAPRAEAGETVLVVEDEPVVRSLIVEVLQDLGYTALEAADGLAGLRLLNNARTIDLLVTDVGLPGLNGRQLADQARERRPHLKVLFITGYAENAALAHGFLEPGMEMITKPFAVDALAAKIRSMISAR
ncbi:MAG TPA: PAS domain S-box protein [Microvirga sp.]